MRTKYINLTIGILVYVVPVAISKYLLHIDGLAEMWLLCGWMFSFAIICYLES